MLGQKSGPVLAAMSVDLSFRIVEEEKQLQFFT